jgi:hypothetical protein
VDGAGDIRGGTGARIHAGQKAGRSEGVRQNFVQLVGLVMLLRQENAAKSGSASALNPAVARFKYSRGYEE